MTFSIIIGSYHELAFMHWADVPVCDELGKKIVTNDQGSFSIDHSGNSYIGVVVDREVTLLTSTDQGQRFTRHEVQDEDREPHHGVSVERFTGGNSVNRPTLMFSTGERNALNHVVQAQTPS